MSIVDLLILLSGFSIALPQENINQLLLLNNDLSLDFCISEFNTLFLSSKRTKYFLVNLRLRPILYQDF